VEAHPPFSILARVYDRLMEDVPYAGWAEFVLAVLGGLGFTPRTVLELGVGTGNALLPFLERGLEAWGVDGSEAMLAAARAKLPGVPLFRADFRSFNLERSFDLVYSAFDSLNNLIRPEDLQKAFAHAHAHLNPGGWLAADLNTPEGLRELWREEDWEEDGVRLVYGYDAKTKLGRLEAWVNGEVEVHLERGYTPAETKGLLEEAGFTDVICLTYPEGKEPHLLSDRFWVFARKPHAPQPQTL
jgi:SAM-dependent methyltransferase